MRPTRALISLALVGLAAGCGGSSGPSGPTPGVLTLTLSTPNTGDGAVLFRVTGGTVDSVAGAPMVADGSYNTVGTTTRIVVAGPITGGVIAHLFVPDVGKVSTYVVTVEQVAVNATFAQRSTAGYSIAASAP
jgi:hypothetical protein